MCENCERYKKILRRCLDYLYSLGFIEEDNGDFRELVSVLEREVKDNA